MSAHDTAPGGTEGRPTRERSLAQRLFLLFIIFSLGPLLITNLWGYIQTGRYVHATADRNVRNVASLAASESSGFVASKRALVSSLVAGNEHLFGLLRSIKGVTTQETRQSVENALERLLRAKVAEDADAREFLVLAPDRTVMGTSHPERPLGSTLPACRTLGPDAGSLPGFASQGDEPVLSVTTPVHDSLGHFLGYFCGRFRFRIHDALVHVGRERTSHAALYLVDDAGRVLATSLADDRTAPDHLDLAHGGLGRGTHTATWELPGGDDAIVAYAPLSGIPAGVVVEEPLSAALASLHHIRAQAVAMGTALAILLTLAVFFTSRGLVRPLEALADAAARLTGGALGARVPPKGPKEVAHLARTFNEMSEALADSYRLLEHRVEERTRSLEESRRFSELLLNSIDYRVLVYDRDLVVTQANDTARRLHGDTVVGSHCCEAFDTADHSGCPAEQTLATGRTVSVDRTQHTLGGTEIFHVETYPVHDHAGEVGSVVEIARVVTAERQVQAQMMHQEKMAAFGLLAAGVAHEIGNPLAAIQSQLKLAEGGDETHTRETLGIVGRQVERISRLLRDIVDFARRQREEVTLVSANQVVEDVVRLLRHEPRARTIQIETALAEHLPGIRTREDHLVQVLLNLGINALDAMSEGGTLTFTTTLEGDLVVLRARDTGTGIPEAVQRRVFEPFFTTKPSGRGTGLGLFVSRGIIEDMDGRLEVERTGPEGTVFAVRLPYEGTGHRAEAVS